MLRRTEWRPLRHYQGHEVSSDGQIRNIQSGQILKTSVNQTGVRYVAIRNTTLGKYENKTVGVLVAEEFCAPGRADEETVLHLDGNTENNEASNLMWATRWHAMAYHQEINSNDHPLRKRIKDSKGQIFQNVVQAAMATGCLPSAIDYAVRYNDSLAIGEHANFVHRVYPGGHVFRSA
jgi:hypothetical protein